MLSMDNLKLLCELSKLHLSEDEMTDYQKEMTDIINLMDTIGDSSFEYNPIDMTNAVPFGESVDFRFYMSQCFNENSAAYSFSHCTTEQLMFYDFSLTLDNNIPVKICKNCNMPFIPKGRIDSLYCDRLIPGTTNKCSAVGSINTYKSNLSDVELAYYAATRRYNTRVSRNPLLKPEFEAWKIKAREKLTAYREGNLSVDEFKNWFMDDEWMKLI